MPVVHRPTFLADFEARRDERSGEDEWAAVVLSLIAATLAQVPWAFGIGKADVRDLVQKCWERIKQWLYGDFSEFSVGRSELFNLAWKKC